MEKHSDTIEIQRKMKWNDSVDYGSNNVSVYPHQIQFYGQTMWISTQKKRCFDKVGWKSGRKNDERANISRDIWVANAVAKVFRLSIEIKYFFRRKIALILGVTKGWKSNLTASAWLWKRSIL